jgi:hypothetical protein
MPNGPHSGFLQVRQHFLELEEFDKKFLADLMARVRVSDILEALGVPGKKFGRMTL